MILLVTGPNLVHVYDTAVAQCRASGGSPGGCINPVATDDGKLQVLALGLVLIVPVVIGMFWGAPLVARELETGTFRLAWTQSVSRLRWLLVKLGLVGLASAVVGALLSLMVSWWFSPIDKVTANRFSPASFGMHGFVPAGYALFAFALGATTGLLFRRTLPAMAVTLVGFIAARVVVAEWVRPHFMSPVTEAVRAQSERAAGASPSPPAVLVDQRQIRPNLPNALIVSNNIVNNAGQSPTSSFLQKACPNLPGVNGPPAAESRVCLPRASRRSNSASTPFRPTSTRSSSTNRPTGSGPSRPTRRCCSSSSPAVLAGVCVWWVRHRLS